MAVISLKLGVISLKIAVI